MRWPQKLSSDLLRFLRPWSAHGVWTSQQVTLMRRAFHIFQTECFQKRTFFNKWTHDFLTVTARGANFNQVVGAYYFYGLV